MYWVYAYLALGACYHVLFLWLACKSTTDEIIDFSQKAAKRNLNAFEIEMQLQRMFDAGLILNPMGQIAMWTIVLSLNVFCWPVMAPILAFQWRKKKLEVQKPKK